MYIEAWSPEYGSSSDLDSGLGFSEEEVDPFVETADWRPVTPDSGRPEQVAFVDGVDRVEARAFYGGSPDPAPGLFGSVGAGAVIAQGGRARFDSCCVDRWGIFGAGANPGEPLAGSGLGYRARSVAGTGFDELRAELQRTRSELEAELARILARPGRLVLVDGPLGIREPLDLVGYIKSHRKTYLSPEHAWVAVELQAGQRTPIFGFGRVRPRFSWYTRIAPAPGQHPWAAIARCEVSSTLGVRRAVQLADLVTGFLPGFASRAFWDTRAPQNLVPVAALERRLWNLLGNRDLVLRRIRSGVAAGG